MNKFYSWISLFTSLGTLICCAIPSLLVVLGLGSTLASVIGVFPEFTLISKYKDVYFMISGILMFFSLILIRRSNVKQNCPIDKKEECQETKLVSYKILIFSLIIWMIGLIFAYILPKLTL